MAEPHAEPLSVGPPHRHPLCPVREPMLTSVRTIALVAGSATRRGGGSGSPAAPLASGGSSHPKVLRQVGTFVLTVGPPSPSVKLSHGADTRSEGGID